MRPFTLLLPWLCVLCLAPSRAQAQPAASPADGLFTATTCGTGPSFDPMSDGGSATSERDIVGDSTYPALYVYDDGVYAYFRIRLEESPLITGGVRSMLNERSSAAEFPAASSAEAAST